MAKAGGGAAAREQKAASIEEIRTKLGDADAAVLTEYRGLTVTAIAELRGALRPAGTEYKVFKNTLARRAAEEAGLNDLLGLLEGPTAIAFVNGDAVVAAKALREFGRTNPALVVKGGLLGTTVLSPKDVDALADVPPRDVLLARLAGGFQAPLAKAASLFGALQRKTAYAFQALIDQRIAAGEVLEAAPASDEAPAEEPEDTEASTTTPQVATEAAAEESDAASETAEGPAAE
jgi:large subunit ribosomal protein L10